MDDKQHDNLKMWMAVFIVLPGMAYGIIRLLFHLIG